MWVIHLLVELTESGELGEEELCRLQLVLHELEALERGQLAVHQLVKLRREYLRAGGTRLLRGRGGIIGDARSTGNGSVQDGVKCLGIPRITPEKFQPERAKVVCSVVKPPWGRPSSVCATCSIIRRGRSWSLALRMARSTLVLLVLWCLPMLRRLLSLGVGRLTSGVRVILCRLVPVSIR